MSEWGYMVPKGETKDYWLTTATEDGKFNHGDIEVETQPAGDLGNWGDAGILTRENPHHYDMQGSTVRMPPEDFYDIQSWIGGYIGEHSDNPEEFWRFVQDDNVEEYRRVLRGDEPPLDVYDGLPMPFVEIGSNGMLRATQEGRHRTVAALKENLDTMPVRLNYNPNKRGKHPSAAYYYDFEDWREDRKLPR